MDITVIDPEKKKILFCTRARNTSGFKDGHFLEGWYKNTEYYLDDNLVPVKIPEQPSINHIWNGETLVWEFDGLAALSALADFRWRKETSGYTWNGWPVHSDDRAQFKAMAEVQRIGAGVRSDGDSWKFADGQFRSLTNLEFLAMYQAGEEHVARCFTCEAACQVRISGGEYDIETIWAEEWAAL